jgi:hypothetical protein
MQASSLRELYIDEACSSSSECSVWDLELEPIAASERNIPTAVGFCEGLRGGGRGSDSLLRPLRVLATQAAPDQRS